jgi:hypothetical protein
MTVTNSTLSGNSSGFSGGGVSFHHGSLTLTDSTLSGNSASHAAGGMYSLNDLTVSNSTFSNNSTDGDGGGVKHNSGVLTVTNSTFSNNSAGDDGGGVFNGGSVGSLVALSNSTISGNSAGGDGGGVYNEESLTLSNSTITGNSAGGYGGGVYNEENLTLTRTLLSGNTSPYGPEITNADTVIANNFNLFGHDGDAGAIGFTPGATDLVPSVGLSDILNPTLADNGGPTFTHQLTPFGPAFNASPDDADCQPTDQRGVLRPQGAACDIGAEELVVISGLSEPIETLTDNFFLVFCASSCDQQVLSYVPAKLSKALRYAEDGREEKAVQVLEEVTRKVEQFMRKRLFPAGQQFITQIEVLLIEASMPRGGGRP